MYWLFMHVFEHFSMHISGSGCAHICGDWLPLATAWRLRFRRRPATGPAPRRRLPAAAAGGPQPQVHPPNSFPVVILAATSMYLWRVCGHPLPSGDYPNSCPSVAGCDPAHWRDRPFSWLSKNSMAVLYTRFEPRHARGTSERCHQVGRALLAHSS